MDFRTAQPIGSRIDQVKGGYDHNYVLDRPKNAELSQAAPWSIRTSGRTMEVSHHAAGHPILHRKFPERLDHGLGGKYVKNTAVLPRNAAFPRFRALGQISPARSSAPESNISRRRCTLSGFCGRNWS